MLGLGFTYYTRSREDWRDYWRRIIDPRRVPARWFFVISLYTPALLAVAVLLDVASTGAGCCRRSGNARHQQAIKRLHHAATRSIDLRQ
jgi:hypothetical protein